MNKPRIWEYSNLVSLLILAIAVGFIMGTGATGEQCDVWSMLVATPMRVQHAWISLTWDATAFLQLITTATGSPVLHPTYQTSMFAKHIHEMKTQMEADLVKRTVPEDGRLDVTSERNI